MKQKLIFMGLHLAILTLVITRQVELLKEAQPDGCVPV